jgi:hypothetical protein
MSSRVKLSELVREKPYIVYNSDLTRQAYGLCRVSKREFPTETTVDAPDPANNRTIRLHFRTSGGGTRMHSRTSSVTDSALCASC